MGVEMKHEIELRPHIGRKNTPLGPVDVEHDQWVVVLSTNGNRPVQIGYLPKRPGATLLPLAGLRERLPSYMYDDIVEAVSAARAKVAEAPSE